MAAAGGAVLGAALLWLARRGTAARVARASARKGARTSVLNPLRAAGDDDIPRPPPTRAPAWARESYADASGAIH